MNGFVEIPEVLTISRSRLLVRSAFEVVANKRNKTDKQLANFENLKKRKRNYPMRTRRQAGRKTVHRQQLGNRTFQTDFRTDH